MLTTRELMAALDDDGRFDDGLGHDDLHASQRLARLLRVAADDDLLR